MFARFALGRDRSPLSRGAPADGRNGTPLWPRLRAPGGRLVGWQSRSRRGIDRLVGTGRPAGATAGRARPLRPLPGPGHVSDPGSARPGRGVWGPDSAIFPFIGSGAEVL